jgi:ATP-dependent helicase/nuclease subunit B
LPALGADPDAAERGAIIHKIFGDFLLRGNDVMAPEAQARLDALAQEVFAGLEAIPERRDIWIKRFAHAARQFLDYERARDGAIVSRHAEIDGRYRFEIAGVAFELRGRADRIDMRGDDHYEIIDFKTGSIPEANVMKAFLAPQLALEAVIARHAGFAGLAGQETAALTYIKVANGPKAFDAKPYAIPDGMELPQAVDALFRRFQSHVEAVLLSDTHPMGARVLPNPKQRYEGDYDHLARTDEWTLAEAEEAA